MFVNLRTALFQKGISMKQYAEFLGVGEKTVQNKLKGTTDFTYPEFRKTCTLLLPEYNADYLFADSTIESHPA
jgi:transcriptional regulator with XRE-family HTH domain